MAVCGSFISFYLMSSILMKANHGLCKRIQLWTQISSLTWFLNFPLHAISGNWRSCFKTKAGVFWHKLMLSNSWWFLDSVSLYYQDMGYELVTWVQNLVYNVKLKQFLYWAYKMRNTVVLWFDFTWYWIWRFYFSWRRRKWLQKLNAFCNKLHG